MGLPPAASPPVRLADDRRPVPGPRRSSNGYSEAGLAVRARIEIRASGGTWVGDRHEPWSCTLRRTLRRTLPVEVLALGGRQFEIGALPASGFTAPASPRACTAANPDALPDVVSFGGDAMRRALTLTHRLTTRGLRSRRPALDLRQAGGEATALDCTSEVMPVCTQTARGSTTLKLSKACRDGKAVVVDDDMSCDHSYPQPRRRRA